MAQLLIALRRDAKTGKQTIVVKLASDADALPVEHEELHRALVEKLIGQGIAAESLGDLVIERESAAGAAPTSEAGETRSPIANQR